MSEPPIWGGPPEPGGAPDPDPASAPRSRAGRASGGRHAAHRAPRRGLRDHLQRRYVVLGSAVLGLVVAATLLFGAFSDDDDVDGGSPPVTPTTGAPTLASSPSESVVARPTIRATTVTPSPTVTRGGDDGDAGGKKTKKPAAKAERVPVLVLNNSRITGLAARWATTIRGKGWTVTRTDNWTRTDLAEPTLFYARGDKASAERFAKEFDVVEDVRPALSGMGPDLTLVLTSAAS